MTGLPESRSKSWIWDSFAEPQTIPQGWDLTDQDEPGDAETHQYGDTSWYSPSSESEY